MYCRDLLLSDSCDVNKSITGFILLLVMVFLVVRNLVPDVPMRIPGGSGEDVLLAGATPPQSCPPQNLSSHLLRSCNEVIIPGKVMINTIIIFTSIKLNTAHNPQCFCHCYR